MPLGDLLSALTREAERDVARLRADAEARAAAIAAAGRARVDRARAEQLGEREVQWRADAERGLALARHAARARVLAARGWLLERVLAAVRARLPALVDDPGYRAVLARDVQAALAYVSDEAVVLRCTPALVHAVRVIVADRAGVRVEADAAVGTGVRAVSADGVIEVDNTLEGRLDRLAARVSFVALHRLEADA
jgi:vacuolar-type H+-ATPase subunit E/Vma4